MPFTSRLLTQIDDAAILLEVVIADRIVPATLLNRDRQTFFYDPRQALTAYPSAERLCPPALHIWLAHNPLPAVMTDRVGRYLQVTPPGGTLVLWIEETAIPAMLIEVFGVE